MNPLKSAVTDALSVEVIASDDDLDALQPEWESLASQILPRTPFQTPLWNRIWWRHFRESSATAEDEMHVLVFRDAQRRLVAVAPMMLTRRPGRLPLMRQLQYFGADPNVTEIRGPVCRSEDRGRVIEALDEQLHAVRSRWDWVQWFGSRPHPDAGSQSRPWRFRSDTPLEEFYLAIPQTWDQFQSGLSRNVKEAIRKGYNSLKREGLTPTFRVVSEATQVDRALEAFFRLHSDRAAQTDGTPHPNVFESEVSRRFLADYAQAMAARGQLRIFQLLIGEEIVATRIGFHFGTDLYLYYSGYAQAWARYSVMTTLLVETLRWAMELRLRRVHLSTGRDRSKLRWRPRTIARPRGVLMRTHWASELRYRLFCSIKSQVRSSTPVARWLSSWRRNGLGRNGLDGPSAPA